MRRSAAALPGVLGWHLHLAEVCAARHPRKYSGITWRAVAADLAMRHRCHLLTYRQQTTERDIALGHGCHLLAHWQQGTERYLTRGLHTLSPALAAKLTSSAAAALLVVWTPPLASLFAIAFVSATTVAAASAAAITVTAATAATAAHVAATAATATGAEATAATATSAEATLPSTAALGRRAAAPGAIEQGEVPGLGHALLVWLDEEGHVIPDLEVRNLRFVKEHVPPENGVRLSALYEAEALLRVKRFDAPNHAPGEGATRP